MARNIPPVAPALHRIGEALAGIRRRDDVGALVDYSPTAGLDSVRLAGAKWLQQRSDISRVRAERLIQTGGGQQALMLACSAYAKSGDTVLCDIATYPGNRTIAQHGGWSLRGVPADARGMEPEELDRAAAATGARLLILIPTLHNPTTITLDLSRRAEIVEVARSRDLLIIEDDIYRVFGAGTAPTPFAELAPERTVHIASLSKALAPGLRLAFILPPDNQDVADRLMLAQQATAYCPAAAGGLMFVQWMDDGLASVILEEVLAETERRTAMARDMIGEDMAEPHSSRSLHVWIPMNGERARRIASNAIKAGVEVTPPEAPFGEPGDVSGLRLCLGAATDLDQLEEALRVVRVALDDGSTQQRGIV
jgi:DNA-binding transcriptional MocR family regulator